MFSLATDAAGVVQVLGRRWWRRWLWRHYQYMAWSYVELLTATINEGFARVPHLHRLAARTTAPLPLLVMACVVVGSGRYSSPGLAYGFSAFCTTGLGRWPGLISSAICSKDLRIRAISPGSSLRPVAVIIAMKVSISLGSTG